ncbi:MAG: TonB family protein [Bacteroidales bacterium]|nr:TonB family protein [Bacteroidales bacterium]
MQPYQRNRIRQDKTAGITGVVITLVAHALVVTILLACGLKYLDPPPPERTSIEIDFEAFEEPEVVPEETQTGREPEAEEVNQEEEVELVQKAESPHVSDRPNVTPETKPDTHGDVDVPTPPVEEPKLDPRASFPGMSKQDNNATTPHGSTEAGEGFKAGQPSGNTAEGKTEGSANAHVQGRKVDGRLPKPAYASQIAGTVVVQVKVDQYGNVVEAVAGAEGTTVADKALWAAARSAAMKAHFNKDAEAPALQTGTITYIFKLK